MYSLYLTSNGIDQKMPIVSIVCVTLNAAKTLSTLLNSIEKNKTIDFELIIIDGNSNDETLDLLKAYTHIIDFCRSEPDAGIYDAMNKALKYVKGNWIYFIGADDDLTEEFFQSCKYLQSQNTIYYGNVNFYGKDFNKVYDDYYLTKLNICHQSIFYPKEVFSKYKFDLRAKVYADYILNLQCWKDSDFEFKHIDLKLANFADGGFSSFTNDPFFELNKNALFKMYLKPQSYYRYLNRTLGFWGMVKRLGKHETISSNAN